MKKLVPIILSAALIGTIGASIVFASNRGVDTDLDLTVKGPNVEYLTNDYWLDGSPIYEIDFTYAISKDSLACMDKDLWLDEIIQQDMNNISIIDAHAQASRASLSPYDDPNLINTCHVDVVPTFFDGRSFRFLEDLTFSSPDDRIALWGKVTYIKTGSMPRSIFVEAE